jgi:hypothetical protein
VINDCLSEIIGPFPVPPLEISGNGTTIPDRREEATGTQHIHPITRFPSIIVIGGQSIILTTLNPFLPWKMTDEQRREIGLDPNDTS